VQFFGAVPFRKTTSSLSAMRSGLCVCPDSRSFDAGMARSVGIGWMLDLSPILGGELRSLAVVPARIGEGVSSPWPLHLIAVRLAGWLFSSRWSSGGVNQHARRLDVTSLNCARGIPPSRATFSSLEPLEIQPARAASLKTRTAARRSNPMPVILPRIRSMTLSIPSILFCVPCRWSER
jgi:hypothetical protein